METVKELQSDWELIVQLMPVALGVVASLPNFAKEEIKGKLMQEISESESLIALMEACR